MSSLPGGTITVTTESVVTNITLTYWPQFFGGLTTTWDPTIKYFRIGEGGWLDPGTGVRQRRSPSDSRGSTDLDATQNPSRYPADSRYVFEKTLSPTDLTYESPYVLRVQCYLSTLEANNDGFGHSPEFWEIALYSDDPVTPGAKMMVAYGTMAMQVKDNTKSYANIMRIVYAGA